ncbi:hypothetical protein [Alteromonas australica]|uniref:hypothetical protein n=1 Tax=Alteromonas australica TaxID=589873 RepID=UPI00235417DC|nr:hypothetical protein [Alteromonas australica]
MRHALIALALIVAFGVDASNQVEKHGIDLVDSVNESDAITQTEFDKELSDLCFGLRLNKSPLEFDLAIESFLVTTSTTKKEFFAIGMFYYVCPNEENFLHHVLKRNSVNFDRLISQKNIDYPKDIPRDYKRNGTKLTLLELLKENKSHYLSEGWGSKYGLFLYKLENLGKSKDSQQSIDKK